jgi:hypothetical protein
MQLTKGVTVAGLDPKVARSLVRGCMHGPTYERNVAYRAKVDATSAVAGLQLLEAGGFVAHDEHDGNARWVTTTAGNALAMASFLKPITRARAEELLDAVRVRAAAYNADPLHFLRISRLRVFGSYLDQDAALLGDLDLAIEFLDLGGPQLSTADYAKRADDYARASGRRFPTVLDQLGWSRHEAMMLLRARSPYIHVAEEDVERLTDRWETVFEAPAPGS